MTTIVTRAGKGSPLTHTEVDTNFTNLNTAKLETAAIPLGTLGAPSISFLSYSTTGIYSPAGDELGVSMLGSDKIRIKSTGEIIINATASRTTLGITPRLQIEGSASSSQCSMSLTGAGAGSSLIPRLYLSKARSSVNAVVLEDDILGFILFNGGDGSSLVNAGFIKAEVDGTPSAGIVPGRLVFATVDTVGGSGERMIIKNNGNVSIDGTTFNVDAVNNRVGIGTTGPGGKLVISDGSTTFQFDPVGGTGNILRSLTSAGARDSLLFDGSQFVFANSATNYGRFDSSGRFLVGTSTSITALTKTIELHGAGDGASVPAYQIYAYPGTANTSAGHFDFFRSASSTLGANTLVGIDDRLGQTRFFGADGSTYIEAARIAAEVDGTPGASDMPGRLVFSTTPDNGSSPTERMRISANGTVTITVGGADPIVFGGTNATSIFRSGANGSGIHFTTNATIPTDETGALSDNTESFGTGTYRWSTIYAATGSINTSDLTTKQDVENLNLTELNVAIAIKSLIKKYRFKDAVIKKGSDARIHVGVIAQEVEQAFVAEGLDPRHYGMFCEDELEDGSKRLGIRYDELLAFVIAAL